MSRIPFEIAAEQGIQTSYSKDGCVAFKRTSKGSEGTLEIEAGEALLRVMEQLQFSSTARHKETSDIDLNEEADSFERDDFRTGPSKSGAVGEETTFVGVNKAIENRETINLMLMKWVERPKTVLIVEKSDAWRTVDGENVKRLDHKCVLALERICRHCSEQLRLAILVEGRIKRELPHLSYLMACDEDFGEEDVDDDNGMAKVNLGKTQEEQRQKMQKRLARVDVCIALGNDGSVIATSALFDGPVPPVLPLWLDTQGMITRTPHTEAIEVLDKILTGDNLHLGLRVRLKCTMYIAARKQEYIYYALNDMVLDRGPSPFLTSVECYCNGKLITLVQGDGLIIATPTGSTAYNQAAGGAMVHPGVPCILFTPLNPHSLSFRPIILPSNSVLKLQLTPVARAPAWVSFDGRQRQPLNQGDRLIVEAAHWPVPILCHGGSTESWIDGCNAFLSRMVTDYVARFRLRPLL